MSRMNAEGDSLFKDDGKRREMLAREEEKMQSYYKDDEYGDIIFFLSFVYWLISKSKSLTVD